MPRRERKIWSRGIDDHPAAQPWNYLWRCLLRARQYSRMIEWQTPVVASTLG
jgi:hypothetical protein